jgi:hypothetical protein
MAVLKTSLDGGQTWIPMTIGSNGPQGPVGPQGPPGTGVNLKGAKPDVGQLPVSGNTLGDNWLVEADGHLYSWSGSQWVDAGRIQGPQGVPGDLTLGAADARYLRLVGGVIDGDVSVIGQVKNHSPSNVLGAATGFLSTQYTFSVTPSAADGTPRENHRLSYDAVNSLWTFSGALLYAGSLSVGSTVAITGKATSAATVAGDATTTLTTKGYVDAKQTVVAAKPASASGYAEGTLIIVAP